MGYIMRKALADNAYSEVLDVAKFFASRISDKVLWRYQNIKRDLSCNFIAVAQQKDKSPNPKFYGLLRVRGVIYNDSLDFNKEQWMEMFKATYLPKVWFDDLRTGASFYEIDDYLIFPPDSDALAFSNFKAESSPSDPNAIKKGYSGILLKYIGDNQEILQFLQET